MAGRNVAIVGAGMTKFMHRALETSELMARPKASLDSAEMRLDQIGCVVSEARRTPSTVSIEGEYLADGSAAGGSLTCAVM